MGRIILLGNNQTKKLIEGFGHNVINVDFDNANEALRTRKPDLAIVDLTTQRAIAETWHQIRDDIEDTRLSAIVIIPEERVREIELLRGIQDFILHPYNPYELELRIKLILSKKETSVSGLIKIGNIAINTTKYEVTVDGWSIMLTLKEYELLRYLATHKGRVLTREILLDQIWGYDYYGGTRTVDVHIGRLRTKIETGDYSFIKTVRGVGYIFTDEYPVEQNIMNYHF